MNSLELAAAASFVKPINLSQPVGGYTAEVLWACADESYIALEYTVSGGKAEDVLYVIPALTDDQDNVYGSGGGSEDRQGNIQRVYFSYRRDDVLSEAELINLHLEIVATTSQDYYHQFMMWTMRQQSFLWMKRGGVPPNNVGQAPNKPQPNEEVFGPFTFDFSVPVYHFSETVVNQIVTMDGVPVTLARVRLTPLQAQFVFNFDQAAHPQILAKDLFTGMRLTGNGWELPMVGRAVRSEGKVWTSSTRMFLCDKTGEVTLLVGNSGYKKMEGYIPWAMPQLDGTPTPLPPPTWREIVLPGPWVFKFTMPEVEPQS